MTMFAHPVATRPMVLRSSTAAELMRRQPLSLDPTTPVSKAAALLDHHHLDAAPVVDDSQRPCGVVIRASCDAWQEFCLRSSPSGLDAIHFDATTVDEIMNPRVATVLESDTHRTVIERLVDERLPRVYIVNDDGELTGVVSRADVLRHLLAGDTGRRVFRAAASLLC